MTVYAAGAVLWRIENNSLKVALVHRGRYDDWSWAKGKVDPGETLPETAVREIREETGLKVKLGVPLGIQRYLLPNKNLKEVHYWAANVTDKSLATSNFKPNEEVAEVVWFSVSAASKRLTYSHDHEQLDLLVALHKKGQLDTAPLIILRHAKARSRATWKDGEASRPLLTEGNAQAEALPKLLKAFGAKSVFSSPWTRCLSTIAPYAQRAKVKVKTRPEFTETANAKKPNATKNALEAIVALGKPAVVCTHRPVLPTMIESLEVHANKALKIKLHLTAALKPGSFTVVHLSKKGQIVDVELHSPLVRKKK
jgi:8-oxo-dGTP pyrophosphatase MutT (NUDIX family)/phosphohistidine phosphatase SixA